MMFATDDAYALIISIGQYAHLPPLALSVARDADDLRQLLIDPRHCGYPTENVALLRDRAATRAAVLQRLAQLASDAHARATALIYLAGRTGYLSSGPHAGAYLLAADARPSDADVLAETAVSGGELARALSAIRARTVVIIIDGAYSSGGMAGSFGLVPGLPASYYNTLKTGRGRFVIATSRAPEEPAVLPDGANSLFVSHLLEGLRGSVARTDGAVGILDLFAYTRARVADAYPSQHPALYAEIEENVPIAGAAEVASMNSQTVSTAGALRITLTQGSDYWALVAENTGAHELTAISVTLRPPASVFVSDTVIDIPRLLPAASSAARAIVLHSTSVSPLSSPAPLTPAAGAASARLLEKERARLERRIEQVMDVIDRLQEERDLGSGLTRMQLDQQIERQKEALEQYENDLQRLDARAQGLAVVRGGGASSGVGPAQPAPPAIVQVPFSALYRVANGRPERVDGILAVALP